MTTVFAVTSGSYSEYRIDGLYSTREKAEEAIALSKRSGHFDIEEYALDPPNADVKEGWDMYSVVLWTSMTSGVDSKTQCRKVERDLGGFTSYGSPESPHYFATWYEYTHNASRLIGYRFGCYVYADGEERAIKVANERRIMAVANGELQAWELQNGINQS